MDSLLYLSNLQGFWIVFSISYDVVVAADIQPLFQFREQPEADVVNLEL